MRIAKGIVVVALVMALAPSVWADPPIGGVYTSVGGDLFEGRSTRSWPGGMMLQLGEGFVASSWDGASLASQWSIECPELCNTVLTLDLLNPVTGNGQQIWTLTYCGGELVLDGSPSNGWSNGETEYVAELQSVIVIMTLQFFNFDVVGAVTNVNLDGIFPEYVGPDGMPCVTMLISSEAILGSTNTGTLPPDFPAFVDGNCAAGPTEGSWWEMNGLSMIITENCMVPTQEKSWGQIKASYR